MKILRDVLITNVSHIKLWYKGRYFYLFCFDLPQQIFESLEITLKIFFGNFIISILNDAVDTVCNSISKYGELTGYTNLPMKVNMFSCQTNCVFCLVMKIDLT